MCKIYTRLPFLEEIAEEVQLIGDRIPPVIPAVYARPFGVFVRYLQPEHFLVQLSVTADEEIAGAAIEDECHRRARIFCDHTGYRVIDPVLRVR